MANNQSYHALSLLRSIFRLHRKLPIEMRKLGDAYVLNEFKLHRKTKPELLRNFFEEWNGYVSLLKKQQNFGHNYGQDIEINELNAEQKEKLKELKDEIETTIIKEDENISRLG